MKMSKNWKLAKNVKQKFYLKKKKKLPFVSISLFILVHLSYCNDMA